MTHPPRITDESVLVRWMGLEIAKMNEGVVTQRKSLAVLLAEKDPLSVTKKGDTYHFDPSVIATLGKVLPEDLQRRLGSRSCFIPPRTYRTTACALMIRHLQPSSCWAR